MGLVAHNEEVVTYLKRRSDIYPFRLRIDGFERTVWGLRLPQKSQVFGMVQLTFRRG
jgi:hypothetical protein